MSQAEINSPLKNQFLFEILWGKALLNGVGVFFSLLLAVITLGVLFSSPVTASSGLANNINAQWMTHAILVPPILLIVASGGLDLSIGAVIGLSGALTGLLLPNLGLPVAVLISLAAALVIGLINGIIIGGTRINGGLITIAMATLIHALTGIFTGEKMALLNDPGFLASPILRWIGLLVSLVLGIPLMVATMRRPAAQPENLSEPGWIYFIFSALPYVLSSLMAGVVGLIMLGYLKVATIQSGTGFELDMILIAVLAGTPLVNLKLSFAIINMVGAFLATLALVCLTNAFNGLNIPFEMINLIKGAMIVVGCLISFGYYFLAARIKAPFRKTDPKTQTDTA